MHSVLVNISSDPKIRAFWKVILKSDDYTFKFVNNGYEALKILDENNFDLIITALARIDSETIPFLQQIKSKYPRIGHFCVFSDATIDNTIIASENVLKLIRSRSLTEVADVKDTITNYFNFNTKRENINGYSATDDNHKTSNFDTEEKLKYDVDILNVRDQLAQIQNQLPKEIKKIEDLQHVASNLKMQIIEALNGLSALIPHIDYIFERIDAIKAVITKPVASMIQAQSRVGLISLIVGITSLFISFSFTIQPLQHIVPWKYFSSKGNVPDMQVSSKNASFLEESVLSYYKSSSLSELVSGKSIQIWSSNNSSLVLFVEKYLSQNGANVLVSTNIENEWGYNGLWVYSAYSTLLFEPFAVKLKDIIVSEKPQIKYEFSKELTFSYIPHENSTMDTVKYYPFDINKIDFLVVIQ